MAMIGAVLNRILMLGIAGDSDPLAAKYARMGNAAALVGTVFAMGFFIAEVPLIADWDTFGAREIAIIAARFLLGAGFILPLYFAAKRRHQLARRFLATWVCVFVLGQLVFYGRYVPSQLMLIPALAVIVAVHPRSEVRALIWCVIGFFATAAATLWIRAADISLVTIQRPEIIFASEVSLFIGSLAVALVGSLSHRHLTAIAEEQVDLERQRAETLLLNILPIPIASRLKGGARPIADAFAEVTVLFADIVGFTPMSESLSPTELVAIMDRVFTEFDHVVERLGLEKIKTIGDAYMVAGGIPYPREDHASAIAEMALALQPILDRLELPGGRRLRLRVGVCSGAVVAGVIGQKKFIYDLWGDTVNTAARLESHGEPGRIQVSESTYLRLRDHYDFESRGVIELKGKKPMPTWFLIGRKAGEAA